MLESGARTACLWVSSKIPMTFEEVIKISMTFEEVTKIPMTFEEVIHCKLRRGMLHEGQQCAMIATLQLYLRPLSSTAGRKVFQSWLQYVRQTLSL